MPDTASITLVKSFTYRGLAEEWSNTYHFSGTTPADAAAWKALALAIFATERAIYLPDSSLVQSYGYEPGNEHSVAQIDHRPDTAGPRAGSLAINSGMARLPGDAAVWLRARVGTSTSGKKVYVRKYFHSATCVNGAPDTTATEVRTAMQAHGVAALAGGWPGGAKWTGPQGAVPVEPTTSQYVTTRTLKRRGRRP
jgi:hypothetical protein